MATVEVQAAPIPVPEKKEEAVVAAPLAEEPPTAPEAEPVKVAAVADEPVVLVGEPEEAAPEKAAEELAAVEPEAPAPDEEVTATEEVVQAEAAEEAAEVPAERTVE